MAFAIAQLGQFLMLMPVGGPRYSSLTLIGQSEGMGICWVAPPSMLSTF
jgi:hypothetical protein